MQSPGLQLAGGRSRAASGGKGQGREKGELVCCLLYLEACGQVT